MLLFLLVTFIDKVYFYINQAVFRGDGRFLGGRMLIQVEIASFALDAQRNTPVVVLKEMNGERTLPVAIGPLEASTIAIETLEVSTEKPLTIDLVRMVLESLGGKLQKVVITDIVENSIQARIHIVSGKGMIILDCRPSDAIALSLRCDVDLFVDDKVLDRAISGTLSVREKLRRRIRSLDTIEFGKYFLE